MFSTIKLTFMYRTVYEKRNNLKTMTCKLGCCFTLHYNKQLQTHPSLIQETLDCLELSSPYPQVRALGNITINHQFLLHLFKNHLINIDLIQAGMYSSCKMQGPPSPQEPKVLRIFLETFSKLFQKYWKTLSYFCGINRGGHWCSQYQFFSNTFQDNY